MYKGRKCFDGFSPKISKMFARTINRPIHIISQIMEQYVDGLLWRAVVVLGEGAGIVAALQIWVVFFGGVYWRRRLKLPILNLALGELLTLGLATILLDLDLIGPNLLGSLLPKRSCFVSKLLLP